MLPRYDFSTDSTASGSEFVGEDLLKWRELDPAVTAKPAGYSIPRLKYFFSEERRQVSDRLHALRGILF